MASVAAAISAKALPKNWANFSPSLVIFHLAAMAHEKWPSQLFFQSPNLMTDRTVRQVQFFRRAREILVAGRRLEGAQCGKIGQPSRHAVDNYVNRTNKNCENIPLYRHLDKVYHVNKST